VKQTLIIILLAVGGAVIAWPCDCRAPRPACGYVGADAIFLGRVSFTNDDGSGTFLQATLVRFDIEEVFKGIPAGTKQAWVDPGSFTSCYEEYHLGERYLIVAQHKGQVPGESATMALVPRKARPKPLSPGIDLARPPIIYWAPECSGSRPADRFPHIEMDYAMLRGYRAGQALPRIFGRVYLAPFRGWPELNGPQLNGARVTLTSNGTTLRTTTRPDGTFALADAPAGVYGISAELPPFVPAQPKTILTVPEVGCGSQDVALRTTSKLGGIVVDHQGRPTARVPVKVEVLSTREEHSTTLGAQTDAEGRFAIEGIPDTEVRLSYGSDQPSSGNVPYPLVYYPDTTSSSKAGTPRLHVGEQRTGLVLRLPVPPKVGRVTVKVLRSDGSVVNGAFVNARLNGIYTEFAKTGPAGTAELPCLAGLQYQLEAHDLAGRSSGSGVMRNRPVPMVCGKDPGPFALKLDHVERF
jgi:hypothetical protein